MTNLIELTKEVRILKLLEQKRELKAKRKRLDEYDDLVDVNAALVTILKELLQSTNALLNGIDRDDIADRMFIATATVVRARKILALVDGEE